MTSEEALIVVGLIREAAVLQDMPDAHFEGVLAPQIEVLPFEDAQRNVRRWASAVKTDKDGNRVAKFVSSIDDVLDACGVPASARYHVDRAHAEGGMVLQSLRDRSGWEYVPDEGAVPRGVGEFYANAGRPLPTGDRPIALTPADAGNLRALPAAKQTGTVRLHDAIRTQLTAMARNPQPRPTERHLEPVAVDNLPPALQQAILAAEASQRAADAAAFAYREQEQELRRQIQESAPDVDAAREVAADLLGRIHADPLGGMVAALETVAAGLLPGATVAFEYQHEFKGERGPIVGLKVYFDRPVEKPAPVAVVEPPPACLDCGAARRWIPTSSKAKVAVCRACGSSRSAKRSS